MKVRATKTGFYESLRQVGDVFDVPDSVSGAWFAPVVAEGLNPIEPDNHGLGGELGGDGLNPNGEGLNPEPVWVEPTPAEATPETPETPAEPGKGKRK